MCGQLVVDNSVTAFNGERTFFPANGVGITRYMHGKKLNFNSYLTSYIKMDSKCHAERHEEIAV